MLRPNILWKTTYDISSYIKYKKPKLYRPIFKNGHLTVPNENYVQGQ